MPTEHKQQGRVETKRRRCNQLDGKRWLQNSISIWSDVRKSPEECRLHHPAVFPQMLVERLIETFLPPAGDLILDPFAGSGSTIVAAQRLAKRGIGLELSREYVVEARRRLHAVGTGTGTGTGQTGARAEAAQPACAIHQASAADVLSYAAPDSVDLCITSPPYWDILKQRRTADMKAVRNYGNHECDLGNLAEYGEFLAALAEIFRAVLQVLKPRAYCCVVVMDLRKKNRFYPLHSDLAGRLVEIGYLLDDIIVWNRQSEYNNLRPLGYPSVFRINKIHEFIMLFQKPAA